MLQIRTKGMFENNLHWLYRTGYLLEARDKSWVGSGREGRKLGRQKKPMCRLRWYRINISGSRSGGKGTDDHGRVLKEMPGIGGNLVLRRKMHTKGERGRI